MQQSVDPPSQTLHQPHPQLPQKSEQSFDLHQSKAFSIISHQSTPQHLLKFFSQYTPKSTQIQMSKIHSSQKLKLKKYKESVYYGEFSNNKRNGLGIMMYNNGRFYQGCWDNDMKVGHGYEKFVNQCWFQGEYKDGKPDGVGKYMWGNGEYYEGEWKAGVKAGSGMWRGVKGDTYIGEWKDGKADGYGVHTWVNGDRYQGQFKQCLKHGDGIEKFSNGDIYKGQYEKGKPSGFGQYYWQNGSYFKGQFKLGLREGQGIWKRGPGNSDRYEGEYKNDKKQGYGIFTWSTGNVYKGYYSGDVRNGHGQMFWSDGSFYKGQWKNGIQHGQGELYVPGQGLKRGMFQDNVLVILEKESQIMDESTDRGVNDPEKFTYHGKKHLDKISVMPSKLPVRNHKSRSLKPKPIDQNLVIRYTSTQPSNQRPNLHPLLPRKQTHQKRQQKFLTIQRNAQTSFQRSSFKAHPLTNPFVPNPYTQKGHQKSNSKSNEKERILHSSFYMHQIHNRATTSINGSRAEVESGYSGSVEYRGRGHKDVQSGGRVGNIAAVVEEMRYFNRTRLSRDVRRTPNL